MCLAQGHNAVLSMRLEPATPQSQVKHSTSEQLRFPLYCVQAGQCGDRPKGSWKKVAMGDQTKKTT